MWVDAFHHATSVAARSALALALYAAMTPAERVAWGALLATLVAVSVAVVVTLRLRARRRSDLRRIVRAVEDLRGGRFPERVDVGDGSPLAWIAESVTRLGAELQRRATDGEHASERATAVLAAAEECAIFSSDDEGDVRGFSRGSASLLGWDETEVVARPLSLLFEEQAYRDLLPRLSRRALRQRALETRSTLRRHDGSTLPVDLVVRRVGEPDGPTRGYAFLARDATAAVRAEEELRESERLYRGIDERLAGGVVLVQGGSVVHANRAFGELCGGTSAEWVGRRLRAAVAAGDVLLVEDRLNALESGALESAEFDACVVDAAGEPRAMVRVEGRRTEHAGRAAVLLLVSDTSAERAADAVVRRNEARLDAALEALDAGLLVVSGSGDDGQVEVTNRALVRLVGLAARELLGLRLRMLLPRLRETGSVGAAIAGLLEGAAIEAGHRSLVVGEGDEQVEIELERLPLCDRDGRSAGWLIACRDMTERRRSERELERFSEQLQLGQSELEQTCARLESEHAEIARRAAELERANGELAALGEMKSKLLGNVSHELQTPLVSVRGYTEIILRERLGPINEEQRKGLELALRNVDRLISMIDSLLSFSRQESALGRLQLETFALRPLVEEARELLAGPIATRRVQCDDRVPEGLEVLADREKILEVLLNLLSNAVKYNREAGRVTVSAGIAGEGRVTVRVEDTGVGIPAEQIDRVFDRH